MVTAPAACASASVGVRRRRLGACLQQQEQVGEVHVAERQADRRHDDVVHQRLHDGAERAADDDADGEVEDVAPHRKCLEFLEHERASLEVVDGRPALRYKRAVRCATPRRHDRLDLRSGSFPLAQRQPQAGPRPAPPFLGSSDSAPPCASAIWRLSTRPMPEPLALVVKNGTNRLPGSGRPGPFVLHDHLEHAGHGPPADLHPAAGLERGVHGVAHQVDQQLVELVAVGGHRDRRAARHLHLEPGLQRRHPAHPGRHVHRAETAAAAAGRAGRRRP